MARLYTVKLWEDGIPCFISETRRIDYAQDRSYNNIYKWMALNGLLDRPCANELLSYASSRLAIAKGCIDMGDDSYNDSVYPSGYRQGRFLLKVTATA